MQFHERSQDRLHPRIANSIDWLTFRRNMQTAQRYSNYMAPTMT